MNFQIFSINFRSIVTDVLISAAEFVKSIVYDVSSRRQNEFVCCPSSRPRASVQWTSLAVSLPGICPPAAARTDDAPSQDDETVWR